jgi:signal peptidase
MVIAESSVFEKVRYLSYFVVRAFLLAILCLMGLFVIFLAIYFGDLFLNVKSGNYKSPLFNGYVIVSQSMVPTININDAIIVKRENDQAYHVGDIISFYSTEYDHNGMVVTHRIVDKNTVSVNESNYTTKGDNNPIPDRKGVKTENVYGKVLFILPRLGYVQSFLSNSSNFIICIMIPIVIVVLYDLFRILRAYQKSKNYLS